MTKQSTVKDIWRGIDKEFSQAFKGSELYQLYQDHKDELIIGVRNNYLNLYYNCDSIAKIEYLKTTGKFKCDIANYYLGDGKGRSQINPIEICEQYNEITKQSYERATLEKKAQSKLVLLNNSNNDSKWYCIDVEYVKQFNNNMEKKEADFNARFDIIALSKNKPHRVALIELKYGDKSIGGNSGIYKHIKDFSGFQKNEYFENHLRYEIIEIVKSLKELEIYVPFELPKDEDLLVPEFYFITLNNNSETGKTRTPKQNIAGYLFKDKRWNCTQLSNKYCVENDFGDVTKKNNKFYATFLFSTQKLDNLQINDIIDGDYDEKIIPE